MLIYLCMGDFGDDVFEGTAPYYARYRVRYPKELFDQIVETFGLDGKGRLLDLGCGTGELTIPLAKYFEKALALDPDAGMLQEGQKKAKKARITNIEWQKKSSKDLAPLSGHFRLVTMGGSFHWMEQELVLNQLYEMVESGGGVAVSGGAKPLEFSPKASQKDRVIQGVIKKYLGAERRAGKHVYSHPEKSFEDYLQNSKFHDFKEHYYTVEVTRNMDEVVGNLYSTSFASRRQLGNMADDFERELRVRLADLAQDGVFKEKLELSLFTVRR